MERWLHRLARTYGVEPFYQDGTGARHTVSDSTLLKILECMGVSVSSVSDIQKALQAAKLNPWRRMLDEVLVVYPHLQPQSFFYW